MLVTCQNGAKTTDTKPEATAVKLKTTAVKLKTTVVIPSPGDGRAGRDRECSS